VHLPSLHSSYPCSVLGHRPCIPYGTYCSIFSHSPCIPDIDYPIGQTLQLTIVSRIEDDKPDAPAERDPADRSPRDLNTIRDVFSALRARWVPPEKDAARSDTQITLRLSFNSHGGIIAKPRTTYVTTDTPPDVRQILLECSNCRTQTMHATAIHGRAWWRPGGTPVRNSVRRRSFVLNGTVTLTSSNFRHDPKRTSGRALSSQTPARSIWKKSRSTSRPQRAAVDVVIPGLRAPLTGCATLPSRAGRHLAISPKK
jgi:hypothetical protein